MRVDLHSIVENLSSESERNTQQERERGQVKGRERERERETKEWEYEYGNSTERFKKKRENWEASECTRHIHECSSMEIIHNNSLATVSSTQKPNIHRLI